MSAMAVKHDAINLSQGFPDFKSDPKLSALVAKSMTDGYNQYAPMAGDIKLREVICDKVQRLYDANYNAATDIVITAGATQAIFTAIAATISKGDEVIIFTPAYDCYAPTIHLFGGNVIELQLASPHYTPDWDEVKKVITSKTKMIIVNSPHNPSGMVFSEDDMLQLQHISEANDLIVISDEVYEHIIFDGEIHQSAARFLTLAKRTFIVASFGKTFHNTGWKMGYCIGPESLMKEFKKVHQYNVFSVNHPFQKGLAEYLQDENHYLHLGAFYQQKRDLFLDLIKDSRFKIIPSKGTYFQLLDFSEISNESDMVFAERLTKQNKLATIPISVFNKNKMDEKQIRVCFAKREETLKAAAAILKSL
ncbi:putative aminotransferase [unidentified eubacterium SCB49]|nr:putative aminotransferase [unidentified eubacterium SCB49]